MKKNGLYIAFISLFFILCLSLSVGIVFAGPAPAGANEQLQKAPAWQNKDGSFNDHYLSDAAAWLNDRFFLRQTLISTDRYLKSALFGTSGEDRVLVGKDGWLFYGETLNDYTGITPYSQRELYAMTQNIRLMADYCRENGKKFVFVIAPNKNSLYPQYMPDLGAVAEQTPGRQLLALLKQQNVPVADLFAAFDGLSQPLYYATDSHWNLRGAALGADVINAALGVETDWFAGPFTPAEPYTGDLFTMLYPAFSGREEAAAYVGKLDFRYTGNAAKPDAITLTTESDRTGSILVYRDSFGNVLHPYLAASYGSARFSRLTAYDLTGDYDCVAVELVERNLSYLLRYVPVMPSPVADITLPTPGAAAAVQANPKGKAPEGCTLWTGVVGEDTDMESAVYVQAEGTVYQAFLTENNGYAVYLPTGQAPQGVAWFVEGVLENHLPQ